MDKDSDSRWNSVTLIFLGIVFGVILAWIPHPPIFVCNVIDLVKHFVNHDFVITFTAAAAGGAALLLMDFIRQEKQTLADLNTAKAILAGHINNLINLKKQFALPHVQALEKSKNEFILYVRAIHQLRAPQTVIPVFEHGNYLYYIHEVPIEFLLPLEKIANYSGRNVNTLMLAIKAKEYLSAVLRNIVFKNSLLQKIEAVTDDFERAHRIFGLPFMLRTGEVIDAKFFDSTFGLLSNLDYTLFFLNRTVLSLDLLSSKAVAWWLRKKINKVKILDKEYMPPDDFISGWEI